MLLLSVLSCLLVTTSASYFPNITFITGSPCPKNQVFRKLSFYFDGKVATECGPIPCGEIGERCIDDQKQCRGVNDYFLSAMRLSPNNENLLLRCCNMKAKTIYVGNDVISAGQFYVGGEVAAKDRYGDNGGPEYDFIANAKIEPGKGVRVWVYRMFCENPVEPITTTTVAPMINNSVVEEEKGEEGSGEKEQANEAGGATEAEVFTLHFLENMVKNLREKIEKRQRQRL